MMEKEMKQHPKLPVRSIGNPSEGDSAARLGAFLDELADLFSDGAGISAIVKTAPTNGFILL